MDDRGLCCWGNVVVMGSGGMCWWENVVVMDNVGCGGGGM